jgi:hypothetical protein
MKVVLKEYDEELRAEVSWLRIRSNVNMIMKFLVIKVAEVLHP